MSPLRLSKLAALLLLPTVCTLVACMSSDATTTTSSSSGGGEGGAGGSILYISTGSTSGPGGPSVTSGGMGPDAGLPDPHCRGDEGAWEQLTAGPITCTSGTECCVIMNPCLSESQIVAAGHEVEAHEAWPSCALDCNDCVPRAIEVACISGSCLGRVISNESWHSPLRKDHCGTTTEFVKANGGLTDVHFSCGLGPGP